MVVDGPPRPVSLPTRVMEGIGEDVDHVYS